MQLLQSADAFTPRFVNLRRHSAFNTLACIAVVVVVVAYGVFVAIDITTYPKALKVDLKYVKDGKPVLPIKVSMSCSAVGKCGNASISDNYEQDTYCKGLDNPIVLKTTGIVPVTQYTVCLGKLDGTSIIVEFTKIEAGEKGYVTISDTLGGEIMSERIQVNSNEIKIVTINGRGTLADYNKGELATATIERVRYVGPVATGSTKGVAWVRLNVLTKIQSETTLYGTHVLHTLAWVGGTIVFAYLVFKCCLGVFIHPFVLGEQTSRGRAASSSAST